MQIKSFSAGVLVTLALALTSSLAVADHPRILIDCGGICKRRLKSAAGGARKVLHLPGKEDCFFRVSSSC